MNNRAIKQASRQTSYGREAAKTTTEEADAAAAEDEDAGKEDEATEKRM